MSSKSHNVLPICLRPDEPTATTVECSNPNRNISPSSETSGLASWWKAINWKDQAPDIQLRLVFSFSLSFTCWCVFDPLVLTASKNLHREPNCVRMDALQPDSTVVVVGNVHGQKSQNESSFDWMVVPLCLSKTPQILSLVLTDFLFLFFGTKIFKGWLTLKTWD